MVHMAVVYTYTETCTCTCTCIYKYMYIHVHVQCVHSYIYGDIFNCIHVLIHCTCRHRLCTCTAYKDKRKALRTHVQYAHMHEYMSNEKHSSIGHEQSSGSDVSHPVHNTTFGHLRPHQLHLGGWEGGCDTLPYLGPPLSLFLTPPSPLHPPTTAFHSAPTLARVLANTENNLMSVGWRKYAGRMR